MTVVKSRAKSCYSDSMLLVRALYQVNWPGATERPQPDNRGNKKSLSYQAGLKVYLLTGNLQRLSRFSTKIGFAVFVPRMLVANVNLPPKYIGFTTSTCQRILKNCDKTERTDQGGSRGETFLSYFAQLGVLQHFCQRIESHE